MVPDIRDRIAKLAPGRRRRFHWHDAEPRERQRAVNLVAEVPGLHLIVLVAGYNPRKQERARRHGLAELLHQLESAGVTDVILDARRAEQDVRDIQAVDAFRAAKVVGREITVNHRRLGGEQKETLLWIPDIVAGAVHSHRQGKGNYLTRLEDLISWFRISTG
jgi:hypothetical protein